MPIEFHERQDQEISLDEFVRKFAEMRIDPEQEMTLAGATDLLKRLGNNREFMADFIRRELVAILADESPEIYSAQVFKMLDLADGHFLRAVLWPPEDHEYYRNTGTDLFYYGRPHNHNFHFLTVGYHGSGYESDYYEINTDTSDWRPGSQVEIDYVGRKRLDRGKVMLYRAHKDVHSQLPPAELSISLNIMVSNSQDIAKPQFLFSADARTVDQIYLARLCPVVFTVAASLGGGNARQLLSDIFERHEDPLVRFHALKAMAMTEADVPGRLAAMERGARADAKIVSDWSRDYQKLLAADA